MKRLPAIGNWSWMVGILLALCWTVGLAEDEGLRGRQVPEFEISSLDRPAVRYSPERLLGTFYLIDFWATWCGYCLSEMDNLHRVHQAYRDQGLQIISLSLDDTITEVERFRQERWPMPWVHANQTFNTDAPIAASFAVNGVPSIYLVDEVGLVVAMDQQLRGERLTKTLRQVLPGSQW